MVRYAFSALLGGIGDSVHGFEILKRMPDRLEEGLLAIVGTGEFMESMLPDLERSGDLELVTVPVRGAFSRLRFEVKTFFRLIRTRELAGIYLRFRSFALAPMMASRIKKAPLYVEINGFPSLEYGGSAFISIAKKLTFRIDRRLLRKSRMITMVHSDMVRGLKDIYGIERDGVKVIPNGVDPELFKPLDMGECRRELELPEGRIILFVGALEPWQSIDSLIEAFRRVREGMDDVKLVIVGSGTQLEELRKNEDVVFTGRVPYTEVPKYLSSADLSVVPIPPDRLAHPIKAVESLACGVPTCVTDNGSIPELKETVPEFLIDDNEVETLASKMSEILNDGNSRKIADRGRVMVLENYTWDRTVEAVVGVFDHEANA